MIVIFGACLKMLEQTEQINVKEFATNVLKEYLIEGKDIVKSLTDVSGTTIEEIITYIINDIFVTHGSKLSITKLDAIKRLEGLGIDIAKFTLKDGSTLLQAVDSEDEIKYLIEKGADINVKDKLGNSILANILKSDMYGFEMVKYLVEHGAKIDDRNECGETPLMMIQIGKHSNECLNIVKYLIEKGADIEARDDKYYSIIEHVINSINYNFCIHDIKKTVIDEVNELIPKINIANEISKHISDEISRK